MHLDFDEAYIFRTVYIALTTSLRSNTLLVVKFYKDLTRTAYSCNKSELYESECLQANCSIKCRMSTQKPFLSLLMLEVEANNGLPPCRI